MSSEYRVVQLPPIIPTTDRECLVAWRRQPGAESLRPLVERYLPFVYGCALRRTGNAEKATEVARAVFLVLARRARRLSRKTVLAGWLFHVTAVTCRKLGVKSKGAGTPPPLPFSEPKFPLTPTLSPSEG